MRKKLLTPRITVVIPTYNSWNTLLPCLDSILRQTLKPYEIIIVDNASTDETLRNLKKYIRNNSCIKLIKHHKNLGVTGGRNSGIKNADRKTDYFFFFDHDMIADERMLEELVNTAKHSSNYGVITPLIYYWKSKKNIWSAGTSINTLTGKVYFDKESVKKNNVDFTVQIAPAAMLIAKVLVEKLNGFDKRYFATFEDTDFSFRARSKGYQVVCAVRAIAYHDISENKDDEAERLLSRSYYIARNRILFMRDFGRNYFLFLLFLPFFFLYYLRLAIVYGNLKSMWDFIRGTVDGLIGR